MNKILLLCFFALHLVSRASAETLEHSLARAVERMHAESLVRAPDHAEFSRALVKNIESGRIDESTLKVSDLSAKRFVEIVSCYLNGANLPKPSSLNGKPARMDEGFIPLPLKEEHFERYPKWKDITYEQIMYWINGASSNITQWCKEDYAYWYIGQCDNCVSLLIQSPSMQSSVGLDEIKTIAKLAKLCRDTKAVDAPNQLSLTSLMNRLDLLLQNLKVTNNGLARLIAEVNILNLANQISKLNPSLGLDLRSNKFISGLEKRISSLNIDMSELASLGGDSILPVITTSTKTEQPQETLLNNLSKLEIQLQTQSSEEAEILNQEITSPAIAQLKSSYFGGSDTKPANIQDN